MDTIITLNQQLARLRQNDPDSTFVIPILAVSGAATKVLASIDSAMPPILALR